MNDDAITNDLLTMMMSNGSISSTFPILDANMLSSTVSNGVIAKIIPDDVLDQYEMNRFAVDHKVTAQELLKLQEVAPDFAKEIKNQIAKNLAREIATKVSYTKKHDKDTDVHHYIGRVWVFSEDELKSILGIK